MEVVQGYKGRISHIKDSRNYPDIVFIGLIFLYILLMSRLVLNRYDALYVFAYDFGIFDQAIWSTAHGELMWQSINTVRMGSHLGEHFELLLIFLAPFNYIFSDGRFLLVIQTIFLALGALPLYLIAKLKFKSMWIPVVFPLSYFLYPYLHNVNLFDFHGVMLAPLFVGLAWYSIEKENIKLLTLAVLASLLIKEDMFVIVALLCIYAFFRTAYKREAAILAAFSIIYGLIVIKLIIPAFAGGPYRFVTEVGIHEGLVNPPIVGLFEITKELFKPLMFLPLLNPIPYLASIVLLTWHATRDTSLFLYYHYPAEIISLIFISLILGISSIPNYISYVNKIIEKKDTKSNKKRKTIRNEKRCFGSLQLAICLLLIISSIYFFVTISQATNLHPLQYQQTEHDRFGINLLKQIPPDAIVVAQGHLVPRLAHRKYVFMLPEIPEEFKDKIEYIVFDTKPDTFREFWPYKNPDEYSKSFNEYYKNEKLYDLVVSKDGYVIFKRK